MYLHHFVDKGGFASYGSYGVNNGTENSTNSAGGFASYGSYGGENGSTNNINTGFDNNQISSSPNFGRRTGEQTVRPLSLADVQAVTSDESGKHELDGQEIIVVCVLGRVVEIEKTANFTRVTLDDGKDKMEVRIWNTNDESSNEGQTSSSAVDEIQEGCYLKVYGNMRNFKGINNIVALSFKIVENPKEIQYHNLLIKFTSLYFKHGLLTNSSSTDSKQAVNVSGGFNNNDVLTPIQRNVQEILQKYQSTESGASIDDILSSLRSTYSETEIRNTISHLYSEGHIYSTIDEEHYKASTY